MALFGGPVLPLLFFFFWWLLDLPLSTLAKKSGIISHSFEIIRALSIKAQEPAESKEDNLETKIGWSPKTSRKYVQKASTTPP